MGDETWGGRTIRVVLFAKSYVVKDHAVEWYANTPKRELPTVVFECQMPPPNDGSPIEIVGTCRGRFFHGSGWAPGPEWTIRVENCTITTR